MSGFLLDTNVPSELIRIRPDPRVAQWLRAADDNSLYLSVISIGEVCKGFTIHPEEHRRDALRKWLDDTLRPWFAGRILPVSEAISERWGILEGRCQLKGLTVNAPDGLIAATALEHDLTLVTRNVKDFADLGVTIFNPWDAI
jgi:predicted nucleic acid-binding protein